VTESLDKVRALMENFEGEEQSLEALREKGKRLWLWSDEDELSQEDFDRLTPEKQWAVLVVLRLVPDFLDEKHMAHVRVVAEKAHEEIIASVDWVAKENEAQAEARAEESDYWRDLDARGDDEAADIKEEFGT
jgi:hypothetical protein